MSNYGHDDRPSDLLDSLAADQSCGLEERARKSGGASSTTAVYELVARELAARGTGGVLIDVGCGVGNLHSFVGGQFQRYIGVDAVQYDGFPAKTSFHQADLNACPTPLPNACGEVVVGVETIEHLENPRAFVRELVRLAKPGGWVVVTTPNQLSWLSLLTLVLKHQFSAFQDVDYPAHLTALLEIDLRRIAAESGLTKVEIAYSYEGRIVLTPWHYPRWLSRLFPRLCSDNVLMIGWKRFV